MTYKYYNVDTSDMYYVNNLPDDDIVRLYVEQNYKPISSSLIDIEKSRYLRQCKRNNVPIDDNILRSFNEKIWQIKHCEVVNKDDYFYKKIKKEIAEGEI